MICVAGRLSARREVVLHFEFAGASLEPAALPHPERRDFWSSVRMRSSNGSGVEIRFAANGHHDVASQSVRAHGHAFSALRTSA